MTDCSRKLSLKTCLATEAPCSLDFREFRQKTHLRDWIARTWATGKVAAIVNRVKRYRTMNFIFGLSVVVVKAVESVLRDEKVEMEFIR